MKTQEVLRHLDQGFERDLEDVRRFLRVPSVSYTGEGMKETAQNVKTWIESLGGTARLVDIEGGYHPVVYGRIDSGAPHTILIYGMYDVMPADEPGWIAPPFGAEIHDWQDLGPCIINRGAANTKGPLAAFFTALRAIREVEGGLPVDLIFVIEGEEEYGSKSLPVFATRFRDELRQAEAMFFPNFWCDPKGIPTLLLGIKGLLYLELTCRGSDWGGPTVRSIHGANNVWVASPVWRMVSALATMVDSDQRITIDGFFDGVRPPTAEDIKLCTDLAASGVAEKEKSGNDVRQFKWGMTGRDLFLQAQTQPTLNIDGIIGGYNGPGMKTLLPHEITVRMDVRMVPGQDPDQVERVFRQHLQRHGYGDFEVKIVSKYTWSKVSIDQPVVQALVGSYRQCGAEPVIFPLNIGSAPFYVFDRLLGIPYAFGGMGHGGRAHSDNEYCTVGGILSFEKSMVVFLDNYLYLFSRDGAAGLLQNR